MAKSTKDDPQLETQLEETQPSAPVADETAVEAGADVEGEPESPPAPGGEEILPAPPGDTSTAPRAPVHRLAFETPVGEETDDPRLMALPDGCDYRHVADAWGVLHFERTDRGTWRRVG